MAHTYRIRAGLLSQLETVKADARGMRDELAAALEALEDDQGEQQEAWDNASERWQGSDRGAAVAEWLDQYQATAEALQTLLDAIEAVADDGLADRPD